jgi:hypothetical protein
MDSLIIAETLDNLSHSFNHIFNIPVRHPGINGQRDDALIFPVGNRIIIRLVTILVRLIGMQMNGYKMDAGTDVTSFKLFDELVAADFQTVKV